MISRPSANPPAERSVPTARIPTKAEAHSTTVMPAATPAASGVPDGSRPASSRSPAPDLDPSKLPVDNQGSSPLVAGAGGRNEIAVLLEHRRHAVDSAPATRDDHGSGEHDEDEQCSKQRCSDPMGPVRRAREVPYV